LKGTIDADSVDTDNRSRDSHLRSSEFFDVEKFPLISFASTKVTPRKNGFDVTGTFTLHGVTKTIQIPLELISFDGQTLAPRFSAAMHIKRSDFGITDSPRLIGDDVDITLSGVMVPVPKDVKGEKK
jgi:polyisoprenoid-binding protein YceI